MRLDRVKGIFQPNLLWWFKKISNVTKTITRVQPNPDGLGWNFFFLITIIIKLII